MSELDPAKVDTALRQIVAHLDYDLHKMLESDESGKDIYPDAVQAFIRAYNAS